MLGPATTEIPLRDGRTMQMTLVTSADAGEIVSGLPLPRQMDASPAVYRSYYRIKTETYMHAPGAGVICGRIDGQLAGFVFFCADLAEVTRCMRSRTMKWRVLRSIFCGDFGLNPLVLLQMARWARQHAGSNNVGETEIASWIGTVHTMESFRRIGVASALMSEAERILTVAGSPEVALWVSTENFAAVELYEKAGYQRHEAVARIGEECWLMRKNLSTHTSQ